MEAAPLSLSTALEYTLQLCDIIEYLHTHSCGSILYLDCRPDNVIINNGYVHLVDFGNSIFYKDLANRSFFCGSVGYAAPELYNKDKSPSYSSDVYGIGAILYYMLTGKTPLSQNINRKKPFPRELASIIHKCLHHHPARRYQTVARLRRALQTFTQTISDNSVISRKQIQSENTSLVISIAGSDRRVGTTHLAMSLSVFFQNKGHPCLIKDRCTHGIIAGLLGSGELRNSYSNNGIYNYKGIHLFPQYSPVIADCHTDAYSVIINDWGHITPDKLEAFNSSDVCLLVGSGKAWEYGDLVALSVNCPAHKTVGIINFISGTSFYRIKHQLTPYLRMPYYDDWLHPTPAGKHFLEQLSAEIHSLRRE